MIRKQISFTFRFKRVGLLTCCGFLDSWLVCSRSTQKQKKSRQKNTGKNLLVDHLNFTLEINYIHNNSKYITIIVQLFLGKRNDGQFTTTHKDSIGNTLSDRTHKKQSQKIFYKTYPWRVDFLWWHGGSVSFSICCDITTSLLFSKYHKLDLISGLLKW